VAHELAHEFISGQMGLIDIHSGIQIILELFHANKSKQVKIIFVFLIKINASSNING